MKDDRLRQTWRQTDRLADGERDRQTYIYKCQTDRQTDRQIGRQTDKKTDGQAKQYDT